MKNYYYDSEMQDFGTREPQSEGTQPLFLSELQGEEEAGQILLLSFVHCQVHLSPFSQDWLFLSCL